MTFDSTSNFERLAGSHQIVSLGKPVDDAICFFDSANLKDIAAASRLGQDCKSYGIIVRKSPGNAIHGPAFVLTDYGAWSKIRSNRVKCVSLTTKRQPAPARPSDISVASVSCLVPLLIFKKAQRKYPNFLFYPSRRHAKKK